MSSSRRSKMDYVLESQADLISHLTEAIDAKDLKEIKHYITGYEYVPLYYLDRLSTFEEVWYLLESRKLIERANYRLLRRMFSAIERPDLVHIVMECLDQPRHEIDVSKYAKRKSLGLGAFGSVYLFELKEGNVDAIAQIAVKEIKHVKKVTSDRESYTEVKILGKLNHPNVVKFLGYEDDGEKLLIFFEYMSGGSIAQRLTVEGPFTEKETRRYTRDILRGLNYIHSKGVIHRDINGSNILLNSSDTAKLAGFGISVELCSLTSAPSTRTLAGTAPFMAPEVVRSRLKKEYATKLDIWSVGCTVVQMLTAQPPWSQLDNITGILVKIGNGDYPEYKLPHHVSIDTCEIIRKCFRSNPKDRPSAYELLRDILGVSKVGDTRIAKDIAHSGSRLPTCSSDTNRTFATSSYQSEKDQDEENHDEDTNPILMKIPTPFATPSYQSEKNKDKGLKIRCTGDDNSSTEEEFAKEVSEHGQTTTSQKLLHPKLPELPVQNYKETNHDQVAGDDESRQDEQPVKSYRMTFTLDQHFEEDLKDEDSEAYKELKQQILDKLLRKAFGDDFKKISTLKFEEGSIKAVLVIELAGDEDIEDLKEKLRQIEDDAQKTMQLIKSTLSFQVMTVNPDDTREPATGNIHDMHIEGDCQIYQDITIHNPNPTQNDKTDDAGQPSSLHANTNGKTHALPLEHHWKKRCLMIGTDLWNRRRCLFNVLLIITTCVFVPFIGYAMVQ